MDLGVECGERRPGCEMGGSNLRFPTEGERGAGGRGATVLFFIGLPVTPLTGELEADEGICLLEKPPLSRGEPGGTCLDLGSSWASRWRGEAGVPSLARPRCGVLPWLREREVWSLRGPSGPNDRPLSKRVGLPWGGQGFILPGEEGAGAGRSLEVLRVRG